ncbi:VWA domain-containing protein, partial [bacterium]|nr:VWA domain-containing protein [bacterium]
MKKFFVYFALFIAALFIVSCGESEDDGEGAVCTTPGAFRCSGDYSQTCDQEAWKNFEQCTADKPCNATTGKCENGSSGSNGGTDNGAGIHLGIIGFNYKLTEMGIRLLSNASDFTSFIDSLNRENNTALYYADDMALERMKEYNKPPKLEHVALVTFTDGIDNQSIAPELKPEYDTPDAYLDDLSKKIHNEKIHGLSVESYTIGLRTADEISELKPKFDAMLNKLASSDSYAFPVDDMNEVKKHFADIANSLVQVSRSINYGVYMPSGYPSGKIRYTFDNAQSADSSELYIEANYNKDTTTLESVTYHGFKTGATTIKAQQGIKGTLLYRFDDLKYSDGSSVSEDMSFTLWQQIDGKWKSETEITPADYPPEVTKDMSSALIVLVLDCTTSLSEENFRIMKDAAKDFVRTLANASGNGGGNNTDPTEPTTDPTNQDNGAKEACTSIYECYAQCQDSACAQACLDNGTPEGQ